MINKEIEEYLKKNKIYLTVSLDGTKLMNDSNRFDGSKVGTYDYVKNNTKNLKDNITVRATLSSPNLDVKASVTHIVEELGFKQVAWAEADNLLDVSDYQELKKSTFSLIEKLENDINEGNYQEIKKYHTFLNNLRKFHSDGIRSRGCGAGSNLIAIDIDGYVYPYY